MTEPDPAIPNPGAAADTAPPAARLHPPTVQRPLVAAPAKTRWPGVIGTIAIVVGALGILISAWGVLQQVFITRITAMVPGQEPMIVVYERWRTPMIAVMAAGVLVAAVLLAAGIMLVRRKPGAAAACLVYAVLRTVQGGALAVTTGLMQRDLVEASMTTAASGNPAALAAAGATAPAVAIASAAAVMVWALALPAFLFVWFVRPKIRREVRSWRAARAPAHAVATLTTPRM